MSDLLGSALPPSLQAAFTPAEGQEPSGQCFVLVTSDDDGLPRACLLSIGELLAVDDRTIRMVVWPNSTTTANLDRAGSALIVCAVVPDAFHIKGRAVRLPAAPMSDLARFELRVESVEVDGHEGMPVSTVMEFTTKPALRDEVRRMWATQLDALKH